MRVSKLFSKTQREIPADADTISHQLLIRAGMIHQLVSGAYSYLPLGYRILRKIENIVRDEMNRAGGQEVNMPVMQPHDIWEQSGRDEVMGKALFTLYDRRERKLALGPTHEEVITLLAGRYIQSFRDLPQRPYQIQVKLRDEPRPRAGLLRVREFLMLDMYSFDADEEGLDESYNILLQAYNNLYERCGLPTMMVEADSGAIGGKESHEFFLITDSGEDLILHCDCGYAANQEKAELDKGTVGGGEPLPIEEVPTPGKFSIEEVAGFFGIPESNTLKAVFYIADGKFVFGVIRGDLDVNEIKIQRALDCMDLRMATEEEVIEAGIVPGAASPVGITGITIIADNSVSSGSNFVAGANKSETHIKNVNYPRDFTADIVADIAKANPGDTCPRCGGTFKSSKGIEVGHNFKLGTLYSEAFDTHYIDKDGDSRFLVMGCYGIGLGRLLAAAVEQNHDDKGIIWPMAIAPYHVYLCPLYREGSEVLAIAEKLYAELTEHGIEVLIDDREESPGVKFNDADLLGIPVRVTVSPRSLEKGSVEIKKRAEKDYQLVPLDESVEKIVEMVTG
ncbi:MAG: proline--tRNA ligase [Dehalococcoidales bacterium]|nr:MAG: proline--tRNA ligase [Dehalococcoidales bacterium]